MTDALDRKDSHLAICLSEPIEPYDARSNGLSAYRFEHDALPELDFDRIRLETRVLGRDLAAPLIIGAMTGGTARAAELNQRLAQAAERAQVGLALGSQRKMLVEPRNETVQGSFLVRRHAPRLPLLFGNLGAVQLNDGVSGERIRELIERTGCDAFNFHLNPLQEAVQPEGDRDFAGLLGRLRDCAPRLGVPVLLKEVGAGISAVTARKIRELPIQGVETAGVGGTSWSRIEGLRAVDPARARAGALFARWGITTAESIEACRAELPGLTLIASGGIRNGIEAAKALALGADAVAVALPILRAAEESSQAAEAAIRQILLELRMVLFVTGVSSIAELRARGPALLRPVRDQNA
jgi:isopentenyl-diphosphate delta-isomerase